MFNNFNEHKLQRRKFLDIWWSIAASLLLMTLFNLLVGIGPVFILGITAAMQGAAPGDGLPTNLEILINLICTIGTVIGVFLAARIYKLKQADIGRVLNRQTFKEYLWGAALGFVMLVCSILPAAITGAAKFSFATITGSNVLWLLVFGICFVVQSFSEEYLCRGFIMKRLSMKYDIWRALMLQAVIFMSLHAGNPGMGLIPYINLFLIGFLFGQVVIITDNLMLASGLHWLWNYAQGCIFGIKVSGLEGMPSVLLCELSGTPLITGGDFGIEGALSTTIVTLIVIGVLFSKMLRIIDSKTPKDTTETNKNKEGEAEC